MVEERYQVPLSPPSSPRMSDKSTKTGDYHHGPHHPHNTSSGPITEYQPYSQDRSIPPLRSYRSTPYSLGSGAHYGHESNTSAPSNYDERHLSSGSHSVGPADVQSSTYNDSTPASPADRLTPRSPGASNKDQADDDDLVDDFGGEDPEDEGERPPMTAAELRAQKRKMKRFRLTHNQTRFLMSEFARQPHPDAAQRERLAREIPGLSARQVQVWFQNRRAKLKRLTQDDRERMMRSRALPSGFDTTQALHSPFGAQPPSMGAPMSSIGGFPTYGDSSAVRPLTLDTLRRVPDYEQYGQQYASPTGVSPALGAFAFTPPQSASDHLSPGSAASSMSPYVLQQQAPYEASRRPPTGLPSSGHTSFAGQPHLQRLPLHERLNRTMGESTGSPLRTSVSYSTLNSTSTPRHIPERAASFSEHSFNQQRPQLQSIGNPSGSESGPYGLGFSYSQVPQYQQTHAQQQSSLGGQVQHATDSDQFRRPAYSAYPASTYSTSQVPQYAGYPAHYSSQNYSSAYAQHGQVTEPVSQPGQPMHEGHQSAAGAPHQYMLGGYNGHQVTESQSHDGGY
ncbi:Protein lin-11 [Pseudocercospora fuligena]|uniref:Protein lin-11 n=1 Tax=Pseudocercospora fuligena TaxID=685502 RepID=A0A8H6VIA9_9PEZI|nr:Protein lin-11 [Pseudocercospora fuligena]